MTSRNRLKVAAATTLPVVAVVASFHSPAQSQSTSAVLKVSDPGGFVEAYLDKPPEGGASRGAVVGAAIVGVRLDGPDMPFDPSAVRVRLGSAQRPAANKLCLKVISRDGRYFARAQYGADGAADPAPLVEFRTAYKAILSSYSNRDVAASAYIGANCNGPEVEYVVSQLTPSVRSDGLIVQIRAGEARVRAQLTQGANPVGQAVLCDRFQNGPTVGYTGECSIKLPADAKSGKYQINIGETSSTGDIKVKAYPLTLWLNG